MVERPLHEDPKQLIRAYWWELKMILINQHLECHYSYQLNWTPLSITFNALKNTLFLKKHLTYPDQTSYLTFWTSLPYPAKTSYLPSSMLIMIFLSKWSSVSFYFVILSCFCPTPTILLFFTHLSISAIPCISSVLTLGVTPNILTKYVPLW